MVNRRRFLEDSILAATAGLAGPAVARSAEESETSSTSPNERLAVACSVCPGFSSASLAARASATHHIPAVEAVQPRRFHRIRSATGFAWLWS